MGNTETYTETGWVVEGRFYPWPGDFRPCDPVLITEVTGMSFLDFKEASSDPARVVDPILHLGYMAASIWQHNPTWPRERVRKLLERTNDFRAVEPEPEPKPDAEADARPPEPTAPTPETAGESSKSSPADGSESTPQTASGSPGWDSPPASPSTPSPEPTSVS